MRLKLQHALIYTTSVRFGGARDLTSSRCKRYIDRKPNQQQASKFKLLQASGTAAVRGECGSWQHVKTRPTSEGTPLWKALSLKCIIQGFVSLAEYASITGYGARGSWFLQLIAEAELD